MVLFFWMNWLSSTTIGRIGEPSSLRGLDVEMYVRLLTLYDGKATFSSAHATGIECGLWAT
jgi:hypothetical protein